MWPLLRPPDPFQKFALCAPDRHWGTIQAGQGPDTAGFLEANTEPLAPVRKQGQAVEICDARRIRSENQF